MAKESLYRIAKNYVDVIERLENTKDKERLIELEEQRLIWHNKLIHHLKRKKIFYVDREHVTRLAYQIVRREE